MFLIKYDCFDFFWQFYSWCFMFSEKFDLLFYAHGCFFPKLALLSNIYPVYISSFILISLISSWQTVPEHSRLAKSRILVCQAVATPDMTCHNCQRRTESIRVRLRVLEPGWLGVLWGSLFLLYHFAICVANHDGCLTDWNSDLDQWTGRKQQQHNTGIVPLGRLRAFCPTH